MTPVGSTTTDDGSFGPDDFSDGESSTITSDSQQGSLSSRDTNHLGHQQDVTNNDSGNDMVSSAPTKQNGSDAYLSLTVTNSSATSSTKSSSSSFEEKPVQRANCHAQDDDEEEEGDDDSQCTTERFFIVKSTYPKYSKWDSTDPETAESDRRARTIHKIVPPLTGFESGFQAEYEARRVRNECEAFRGACAPLDDDGEFSEFEDDYHFNSFDEPPWDSEVLEECDREEEVIIDCMTWKQFKQKLEEKASDEEYIDYMDKEFKCEETIQIYECKLRVQDSGCNAYYSYPTAQPWDIKAEMEVRESTNCQKDAARKMRPEIDCVKSFMFKGRQYGVFGYLLENCHRCDYDNNDDVGCDRHELEMCALLRHLQASKSLRELFIQLNTRVPDNLLQRHKMVKFAHVVNKTFIQKLVYVAPHLDQLRVLSFGPNITLYPRALEAISKCLPSLERLDISFALSMEFAPQGDDEVTKYYPYESPLLACVTELDKLNRLDLGFEMVDFHYTDSRGRQRSVKKSRISCLISEVALQEIRETLIDVGGIVTETHTTKPPPWEEEESDKRLRALQEMILDPQLDDDTRETAMEKHQELEEYLKETSNVHDQQHQSNFDLLLEASGRCNAIEEVRLHEQQQQQQQRSPPAKDTLVEGDSLSTIAISETSDNVGTDSQVDTHVNDEDIYTIDDVEEQPSTPNSKKRNSNVTLDDATNSKRFCV